MCISHTTLCIHDKSRTHTALYFVCSAAHAGGKVAFCVIQCVSQRVLSIAFVDNTVVDMILPSLLCRLVYFQRRYFLRSSDCHMYFLSGKWSGILMRRKSWMHFSSSCSGVIFSLFAFLFAASRSLTPKVLTRSPSVLRRISACCIMWLGPLGIGRSSVWMWECRLTGPQITVPWGELASDWVSEQEVESSLTEVPLSPSRSLLWLLQQQSQWEDIHLEGPPENTHTHKHKQCYSKSHLHAEARCKRMSWWCVQRTIQALIKSSSFTDQANSDECLRSSFNVIQTPLKEHPMSVWGQLGGCYRFQNMHIIGSDNWLLSPKELEGPAYFYLW